MRKILFALSQSQLNFSLLIVKEQKFNFVKICKFYKAKTLVKSSNF